MPHIVYAQYATTGTACLWGLWALVELTDVGTDFMSALMLIFFAGVIAVAWICCSAAVIFVPGKDRRRCRLFWFAPLIGAGALALCSNQNGLKLRVWLCESTLREHAEVYRQNPKLAERQSTKWIGMFEVRAVLAQEDQVAFRTGQGFFCDYGIVYRPDGATLVDHHLSLGSRSYRHLYGPWWRYEESWD